MGNAYFVSVDEDPDLSADMDGKALADNADQLEDLAKSLGISSLEDFMAMDSDEDEEESEDFEAEDDDEPAAFDPPDQSWFDPAEGLDVVTQLMDGVKENPEDFVDADGLLEDLENLSFILEKALDLGARWHLSIDY